MYGVVRVFASNGPSSRTGSGFFWTSSVSRRLIVTAWHVVGGSSTLFLGVPGVPELLPAHTIGSSPSFDVAVLELLHDVGAGSRS